MFRFAAIAARLLVVFAQLANGIGVPAHAMHAGDLAAAAGVSAAEAGGMPCHGLDDAADDTASAPHDCCGKTCACDFVAAAALLPVAARLTAVPAAGPRLGRDDGLRIPARIALPLRPPIG